MLLALAASAALYMQYLEPGDAAFCGLKSGCEAVRKAGFSYFLGSRFVSVPLFGLLGYGSVFAASLWEPRGLLARVLTVSGGVAGAALLAVQAFYIHAFCWLCTVVDVSAIVAAVAVVVQGRSPAFMDPLRPWGWTTLAALSVAAPVVWVGVKPAPPIPPAIAALYAPGKINVVEFADFECPFCRAFHPVLQGVLHDYPPAQVHFVRKHVPLEAHEQALPAARADVCAEEQGKGDELADKLVTTELSASVDRRAALEVGVDAARFDRCLASQTPDARVKADTALLKDVGFEGLPTTYIGNKRLLGAVSEAAVRDAVERAARGDGSGGVPGVLYAAFVAVAALAVVWLSRLSRGKV
ncbi:MAG TPA: thioredoxin domain-containing protein [Polyangiaceae bacterium]|nr:thioredoxin domain-containing protein [Polyangiaceae bacterium]